MFKRYFFLFVSVFLVKTSFGQDTFNRNVVFEPIEIADLPGLHSYSAAQHDGKWLVIGGRLDGLHARQPFASFPESQNNTDVYVIDPVNLEFWSASVNVLPVAIAEQMQSTNMCFHQLQDTLYMIGGYGYSATNDDHITYDKLTTVIVSEVIDAVMNGTDMNPYFKQIADPNFAVTGGHLTYLNQKFYLVGGHRFDGNYNPMGNPTYTQTYTNQIRMFHIDNSGSQLSFTYDEPITDEVHLHRRDYNLIPQVFPDLELGFTISSGVFQTDVDLPYLYPVDITASGYNAVTSFNQYLCHYHTANAGMYDAASNSMHTLFFGGMSQYYFDGSDLVQDDLVPFVKTISRLSRTGDGTLSEYQMSTEMPAFQGASAEFFYAPGIPQYDNGVIRLNEMTGDSIFIGYIYGGIYSATRNPFSVNQTSSTSADNNIYGVWLVNDNANDVDEFIPGANPYQFTVVQNQAGNQLSIEFILEQPMNVTYLVTNHLGQLIAESQGVDFGAGEHRLNIPSNDIPSQVCTVTVVFDHRYFASKEIFIH
jgi:hypothetical protein